ncbi:YHS domain-containing protein [Dissulfurirhabdus thermomarina]|uniref:YHS domain-containing protein n=1 Tax=Dissulfurirhabdus thermomarina TaxID=1765737 RepID=A0A6N9TQ37_DISTH|nr:YHS domain-containing protein [Dissulfurirhabdus thermomarina]NDY43385.1 YHS domain-containing protein [Dissulfurirhabdus thermomarina]NMX22597.1 YHS domain-containing protein [Dissulfurirhabdus thermomarina]
MRFLLFLALLFGIYYVAKALFGGISGGGRARRRAGPRPGGNPPPITDELVRDPVCGVYVPRRDALRLERQGRTYHFCSRECRRRFRERSGADDQG